MSNSQSISAKPFLRWAGGKTWLIKYMKQIIGNTSFHHYHEPFLGGGSIFFNISPKRKSYLSDLNKELTDTYNCIKSDPLEVIKILGTYENSEDFYYKIRDSNPENQYERAAKFIYLNQTSYNGIYRVNLKGKYNVPYGHRSKPFLEPEKIIAASKILKKSKIDFGDFTINKDKIKRGDLVFLDPPYTVTHNNNGFIKYNQRLFSLEDQYRLSEFIDYIRKKGAFYILTNAAHRTILDIFEKGDRRLEFHRACLIGGENAKREQVSEYIFTNIRGED